MFMCYHHLLRVNARVTLNPSDVALDSFLLFYSSLSLTRRAFSALSPLGFVFALRFFLAGTRPVSIPFLFLMGVSSMGFWGLTKAWSLSLLLPVVSPAAVVADSLADSVQAPSVRTGLRVADDVSSFWRVGDGERGPTKIRPLRS